MKIQTYTEYEEERILALYRAVGWSNYYDHPDMLKEAFAHSLYTAAAYADGEWRGIIRCVGDGHSIVCIQDLLVFPEWQGQGIGMKLMKHVLDVFQEVYQIVLLTDGTPEHIAFYKKCGMANTADWNCTTFMKMNV